jgi:hypothetical protein
MRSGFSSGYAGSSKTLSGRLATCLYFSGGIHKICQPFVKINSGWLSKGMPSSKKNKYGYWTRSPAQSASLGHSVFVGMVSFQGLYGLEIGQCFSAG